MKFYYRFSKGSKWVQLNGEGTNPTDCNNVEWTASHNNNDVERVIMAISTMHPKYGFIKFEDYENDLTVQILKLGRILKMGYRFDESNFADIKNDDGLRKNDVDLWKILLGDNYELQKARKYITDPSKAPKGAKVQRGKKGGYFYDAAPVRTSLKVQPEEVKNTVKDLYAKGYDAKMIASELQDKHDIKVHPETVNRFLEHEGVGARPKRNTVSRADVESRDKILDDMREAIKDYGKEMDALRNENADNKKRIEKLNAEQQTAAGQIGFLTQQLHNFTQMGRAPTEKELADILTNLKEMEREPSAPEKETERQREPPEVTRA